MNKVNKPFKNKKTPKKNYNKTKLKETTEEDNSIRLNKYLSNAGVCSRREADELIKTGKVTVNGKVVEELGIKVQKNDKIKCNGKPVRAEKNVYILMNKPKDTITSNSDESGRKTVIDILRNKVKERIYPVGRLDRNSTGVLLLTNDGKLTKELTHPKYKKKKIYAVTTDKNISSEDILKLSDGLELEDGFMKFDAISYVGPANKNEVGVEIHSGRNRIIRRMFQHLGYEVIKLDRVLFAGFTKKGLGRGKWRYLNEREVGMLKMKSYQ